MTYSIYEGNMERLEKKLARIKNKCNKYGCSFTFEVVGEEFKEIQKEGETVTIRFVIVNVEGTAIINDWKFIARIDSTSNGNIFMGLIDEEIPERYYNCELHCEHCHSARKRKNTFIIKNIVTGEFKQVGKTCLKDYTNGMDAELVAQYVSLFNELIEGEKPYTESAIERYYCTEEYLKYCFECVKHFGYSNRQNSIRPTSERAFEYMTVERILSEGIKKRLKNEMESVEFNTEDSEMEVEKALKWLKAQNDTSTYIHNLKVSCLQQFTTSKHFGIIASLTIAYSKAMERESKKEYEESKKSEFIGTIGERIDIEILSLAIVTGWETDYGYTFLYKITDPNDNIFIWKTSKRINENAKVLRGTIKAHKEFNGTKQTELTRCKIS